MAPKRALGDHVRVDEQLADHEPATRPQYAPDLAQGSFLVGISPSTVTR